MNDYKREVEKSFERQKEFFNRGHTKKIPFRIQQLKILKAIIKIHEKEIMDALYQDLHKSSYESYLTEISYVYKSIGRAIKNLEKWSKMKKVKTPWLYFGMKSFYIPEPYGTVLIMAPFNYPFQLIIEPLVGAIAAGNTAVLKPSEFTPNTSAILEKIIEENFYEGFIKVFLGEKEMSEALVQSPFDYIFFTGSIEVGKIVMKEASNHLTPITLELGGKSPVIIDKDADIKDAAQKTIWGKLMNAGQTCVAPDYALVHRDVLGEFVDRCIESIFQFYGENPKENKDYGRIVNKKHMARLEKLIDPKKTIYGGEIDKDELYMEPTLIYGVNWEDGIMQEEIFGPILPIIEFEEIEEAIKQVQHSPNPLALYLFTKNQEAEEKILGDLSFGGGAINNTTFYLDNHYLPFGGVGNSGMGYYHGKYSFNTFSHFKGMIKGGPWIGTKPAYPPFTKGKKWLIRLLKN